MRFYFWDRRIVAGRLFLVLSAVALFAGGMLLTGPAQPVSQSQPIYQGSPRYKEMALTVNVFWGEEYIPQMLDILRRENVKATFFLGGTWVKKYPDLAASIARAGHEIGSHGYSHPHPDQLSKAGNLRDILKAEEVISGATRVKPKLYAPPYGERGTSVLLAAGEASYTTILWSVDTVDWQLPPPDIVVRRVVSRAHNGAIVLMHPTAPTINALPEIIRQLKRDGYQLVTISSLLEKIDAAESSVQGRRIII